MHNVWVFLFQSVVIFCFLIGFSAFGKRGLFAFAAAVLVLANVQVTVLVNYFHITATLGNALYGSSFLATDLLSELYGKKEAKECVKVGFLAILLYLAVAQITLRFVPAPDDVAFQHLRVVFTMAPRIIIASLCGYILSQFHDVWAYHTWKNLTKGKHLWLRNNFSTMVSQLIDSVTFCTVAFAGIYPMPVFWSILLTTYFFKVAVAAIDTPFIYLGVFLHRRLFGNKGALKEAGEERL